jgi:lipopolysaccharide/colanic/teichoic acid biosynthesis glycosyltransferase
LLVTAAFVAQLAVAHQRPLPLRLTTVGEVGAVTTATATATAVVAIAHIFISVSERAWLAPLAVGAGVAASRAAGFAAARHARRTGRISEPAIVVGDPLVTSAIWQVVREHPESGLVAAGGSHSLDDLNQRLASGAIRRVILAPASMSDTGVAEVLEIAMRNSVATYVVLPPLLRSPTPPVHDRIGDVLLQRIPNRKQVTLLFKRPFDVMITLLLMIVTAPLAAAVAVSVRLTSSGPVLYRQKRLGQRGRVIEVLKFRTFPAEVSDDDEEQWIEEAGGWTVRGAESPIAVGRWLRRTSLDELPQLWNVLRGDMSLIGPRPERPELADTLARFIQGYADRHRFPVGLTGLAQVNGLWGPTSIELRVIFDNYYIEHWSLWQDFVILFRTVPEVIRRAFTG